MLWVLQVKSGYIVFLRSSPEAMAVTSPDVICPPEDVMASSDKDGREHWSKFQSGSKNMASMHGSFMEKWNLGSIGLGGHPTYYSGYLDSKGAGRRGDESPNKSHELCTADAASIENWGHAATIRTKRRYVALALTYPTLFTVPSCCVVSLHIIQRGHPA